MRIEDLFIGAAVVVDSAADPAVAAYRGHTGVVVGIRPPYLHGARVNVVVPAVRSACGQDQGRMFYPRELRFTATQELINAYRAR